MISRRQLKKQLQKLKEQIQVDVMDWTVDISQGDYEFIISLIPSLSEYTRLELIDFCKDNDIYNYMDLCNHFYLELGIGGE